jgi:3-(3-hydroxy-phenyl)propionate hydroxylase
VLALARRYPFARALVNSGRLSVPAVLTGSPLNTPDGDAFACKLVPGAVAADAPVDGPRGGWLLDHLGGDFVLLTFGGVVDAASARALAQDPVPCRVVEIGPGAVRDTEGLAAARYDGRDGTCYLLRPDQHVCARWRAPEAAALRRALRHALALP